MIRVPEFYSGEFISLSYGNVYLSMKNTCPSHIIMHYRQPDFEVDRQPDSKGIDRRTDTQRVESCDLPESGRGGRERKRRGRAREGGLASLKSCERNVLRDEAEHKQQQERDRDTVEGEYRTTVSRALQSVAALR